MTPEPIVELRPVSRKRRRQTTSRTPTVLTVLEPGTPQRQLGHADLRVTSRYLSGITTEDVLDSSRIRPLPTLTAPDMIEALHAR